MKRRVKSSPNGAAKRGKFSDDLYDQPGHLIRRAQQIAVSIFHSTFDYKVTPIQYAVLRILQDNPGIDQVTMAGLCAIDTSTAANLAVRLERRGLVKRTVPSKSKRFRLLQSDAARHGACETTQPVRPSRESSLAAGVRQEGTESLSPSS